MLSTSILSYCNKLLDDDQLLNISGSHHHRSNHQVDARYACGSYRVRYMGSVRSAKHNNSRPLKSGITSLQKPLIDLYTSVQRQIVCSRHSLLTPENHFPQIVDVCNYGVVVSENEPPSCQAPFMTSQREQPVVTKVITPLTNILLWAAVRFYVRRVSPRKRQLGAAFVPIACNDAVLDDAAFTRLSPKQRFLTGLSHPPLFVCVLRKVSAPKVLECHMFMCASAENAVSLCSLMSDIQSKHSKVGPLELPPPGRMGCYSYTKSIVPSVSISRSSPDSRTRSSDSELPKPSVVSTTTTTSPNSSKDAKKRRYKKYKAPLPVSNMQRDILSMTNDEQHKIGSNQIRSLVSQNNRIESRHQIEQYDSSELIGWNARNKNRWTRKRDQEKYNLLQQQAQKQQRFSETNVRNCVVTSKPIKVRSTHDRCSCDTCSSNKINFGEQATVATERKNDMTRNWNKACIYLTNNNNCNNNSAFLSTNDQSESSPETSSDQHRIINYVKPPVKRRPYVVTRSSLQKRGLKGHRSLQRKRRSHAQQGKEPPPNLFLPEADYTDDSSAEDDCICCANTTDAKLTKERPIQVNNYNGYLVSVENRVQLEPRDTMVLSKTVEFSSETDAGSIQSSPPHIINARPGRMANYTEITKRSAQSQHVLNANARALNVRSGAIEPNDHNQPLHAISLVPNQDDVILRNRYEVRSNFEHLSTVRLQAPPRKKPKKKTFLGRLRWLRFGFFRRKRKRPPANAASAEYKRYESINIGDSTSNDSGNAHELNAVVVAPTRTAIVKQAASSRPKSTAATAAAAYRSRMSHSPQSMDSGLEETEFVSSTEIACSQQGCTNNEGANNNRNMSNAAIANEPRRPPRTMIATNTTRRRTVAKSSNASNRWSAHNIGHELGYLP